MSMLRRKARLNFVKYLSNDYFNFLDRRRFIDSESYELYIDPIYDEDYVEQVGCSYVCYFDGERVEFFDIFEAEAYSVDYFYEHCISFFYESFCSLIECGIFSRISFSVYNCDDFKVTPFPDPIFSCISLYEACGWLKLSPGFKKSLLFRFYTKHDFDKYWKIYDGFLNTGVILFRDYLFFDVCLDNVDLSDFDYVFDFLRLQERLTGYHQGVDGYNVFEFYIDKDKE